MNAGAILNTVKEHASALVVEGGLGYIKPLGQVLDLEAVSGVRVYEPAFVAPAGSAVYDIFLDSDELPLSLEGVQIVGRIACPQVLPLRANTSRRLAASFLPGSITLE